MVDAIWPFQGQKQDKGAEIFLCFLKEATEPGCQVICRWWWSSVTLRWVRVYAVIFTPAPVVVFMESFWKSCWQISTTPPICLFKSQQQRNSAALILTASTHSQEQCATHLSIVQALQKLSSMMKTKSRFFCCPRNWGWTIFVELWETNNCLIRSAHHLVFNTVY